MKLNSNLIKVMAKGPEQSCWTRVKTGAMLGGCLGFTVGFVFGSVMGIRSVNKCKMKFSKSFWMPFQPHRFCPSIISSFMFLLFVLLNFLSGVD